MTLGPFLKRHRKTSAGLLAASILSCLLCSTFMPFTALQKTSACADTHHSESTTDKAIPCPQIQQGVLPTLERIAPQPVLLLLMALVGIGLTAGLMLRPRLRLAHRALFSPSPPQKLFLAHRTLLI